MLLALVAVAMMCMAVLMRWYAIAPNWTNRRMLKTKRKARPRTLELKTLKFRCIAHGERKDVSE